MTASGSDPHRKLEELLATASNRDSSEPDIKRRVANLIESLVDDQKARLEVRTETGAIDILFGNVIIEAKRDADYIDVAPAWARHDQRERRKYAASQLQDYVNERYQHAKGENSTFDGFTTTGDLWKRWEVKAGEDAPTLAWSMDLTESSLDNLVSLGKSRSDVLNDLLNALSRFLHTRPSPPDDLSQLIADVPEAARELAGKLRGRPEFETKRGIWADLMRGAFIIANGGEPYNLNLFATQSVLVDIARKVAENVANGATQPENRDDGAFYSWLYSDETNDVPRRISREVDRYNWRLAGNDVLKGVYHEFIPRDVRHDFGEYYTPDWLAEAVCELVLDDDWCVNAVERASDSFDDLQGMGILEPSCGSGTFLRAAVLRLIPFAKRVTKDEVEQANMICRLVHGLDIHPVAVELARATMLAALPANPSNGINSINVHVSDSLRWMQDTEMRLVDDDILISVPPVGDLDRVDLHIPNEAVLHDEFRSVMDEVAELADNEALLSARLDQRGFNRKTVDTLLAVSSTLRQLRSEGRNHVWSWYITNLAESHRLHHRKFDRIIGNPPWITRKDIARGQKQRADRHRDDSMRLGIWAGGSTFATQNNLASLFSAIVTRDYTQPDSHWKTGFVLPWAALKSETWKGFRTGQWNESASGAHDEWSVDLSEPPWDLKGVEPRPFPQSHSCVVFGREPRKHGQSTGLSDTRETWSRHGANAISSWNDWKPTVQRTSTQMSPYEPSAYADKVKNGATIFPAVLVRVDMYTLETGGHGRLRFRTANPTSTKAPWKDLPTMAVTVEEECVRKVVFSSDIAPFTWFREGMALLPPDEAFAADIPETVIAKYGMFTSAWHRADTIWQQHRGPNSPDTLLKRVNHLGSLISQSNDTGTHRVVYPKSGSWFFGATVDLNVVIDNTCYYLDVNSMEEASYLCAVFSSDALQHAFQEARNSDRDFHTYPLRRVPVPAFDSENELHVELSQLAARAEKVAQAIQALGPTKTRQMVRDALREDGVMSEVDRCVKELIPSYAKS